MTLDDIPMPRAMVPAAFYVHWDAAGRPLLHTALRLASLLDPDDEDLPDGLTRDAGGTLRFECRSCGWHDAEWCGTPEEFATDDPYYRVCGGSPMCLP